MTARTEHPDVGWQRGLLLLATATALAALASFARAQTAPGLDFQRFPGQAIGGAFLSDPTIRPFLPSGEAAGNGVSIPIDTRGNGRPDLLFCHAVYPPRPRSKQPCRFLRPQPDGSVTDVTRLLLGAGPLPSVEHSREVVIADFNGDGLPDVFIAAHGYDTQPFDGETNVLLLSNGDGTYADRSSTLPQIPDFTHSACAGDINGDGAVDIYVNNTTIVAGPYFLIGNGDGTFRKSHSGLPATLTNGTGAQELYYSCALVDVDGDGAQDLLLGPWEGNVQPRNYILFGDGKGDFTTRPRRALPAALQPTVLDILDVDIDRDGRPDLILTSQAKNDSFGGFALQVLINKGNGDFVDETTSRLPVSPQRNTGPFCAFARLADLNGDGWEDIYCDALFWDAANPRAWLNDGTGRWLPVAPDFLPPNVAGAILHALDVDGDGRPDFLSVGTAKTGEIVYFSYRNHTPRVVPSEPVDVRASLGDAQATLTFKTPLASGVSPITGYTATCRYGTSVGVSTGAASPLTVNGLIRGKPYLCSVTANSAAGTSLASRALSLRPLANPQPPTTNFSLNQHGLTGSWYEPTTSGQGFEVEVFANPSSGSGSAFVSWFTFDTVAGGAERQRWYTAQGQVATGQPNAALTIYRNAGGNFNAPPVTTAQVVGTAILSFDTCSSGQLVYAFTDGTGRTGTIPLTRLTQHVTCSTTSSFSTNADFALSGNWYDAATSGQGLTIEVNPNSGALFAAWYTYVPNGTATDAAGQRWYTAQAAFTPGMRSMPVTIYETTGGIFNTPSPAGQKTAPVGTGTMTFQSCSAATFSYNFTGGSSSGLSGTIVLSRIGPLPPGCTT
jgi:hypothetical protein